MLVEEALTKQIIGAAIEVHKYWGPGLYEEIYERSICHELRLRKVAVDTPWYIFLFLAFHAFPQGLLNKP